MPGAPTGLKEENERKTRTSVWSKFNPQYAFYAACVTIVLLGMSYCSSKIHAPAPIIRFDMPKEFRVVPSETDKFR